MTRLCGCPDHSGIVAIDNERHAEWHREIAPLPRADASTLESANGRRSSPMRTYIDDQFEAERAREALRRQLAGAA